MASCANCGHPEDDHGPESGVRADGSIIPGRLCFYEENQGHCEDLCGCIGFSEKRLNREDYIEAYRKSLFLKAGL